MAEYQLPCGKCWAVNIVEAEPGSTVEWLCQFCENKSMREVAIKVNGKDDKEMASVESPNVSEIIETADGVIVKQSTLEGAPNVSTVGEK